MPRKYATEQDAIAACIRIWELVQVEDREKDFVYDKYGLSYDSFHCPACQYAIDECVEHNIDPDHDFCQFCPIWDSTVSEFRCEHDSPYGDIYNRAAEPRMAADALIPLFKQVLATGKKL